MSVTWPSLSVIVLNYNGKRHLAECFESLLKTNYPESQRELILVDNASTDGSIAFMQQQFPTVRVVANVENLEFAEGTVDYSVPQLLLLAGNYLFSAAIYDRSGTHAYDHHHMRYAFTVTAGGVTEHYGLLYMPSEWKHHTQA